MATTLADVHEATVTAQARFHEDLQLASLFIIGNTMTMPGILPSTTVNPNLSGGTMPVTVTWTVP
jgi:hypothetical protein